MNIRISSKFESGLTLIELMIAMVIGILLLLGTANLFMSNKHSYKLQESMGRLQENARFAMDMLIRDIRMAGYIGCSNDIGKIKNHVNGADNDDNLLNLDNLIEGSESAANWSPSSSAKPANMVANTDGITVRYFDGGGIGLESPYMTPASAALHTTAGPALEIGDIVALTDCSNAEIFQITNIQDNSPTKATVTHQTGAGSPGNATKNFQKTYEGDASIIKLVARRYYIGTGANGPSLFYISNNGVAEELIEGVENMQILFGEDTNADGIVNEYRDADDVVNWDNVQAIRIGLLMRTLDENFTDEQDTNTYNLLGTVIDPVDDHRRRKMFTATILVRNRTP